MGRCRKNLSQSILDDNVELLKLLTSVINSTKETL
jgi:hypothetical protein